MTVSELQKLLENKNPSMKLVIAAYDKDKTQHLYDLKDEDDKIQGGAPTFMFLKAVTVLTEE